MQARYHALFYLCTEMLLTLADFTGFQQNRPRPHLILPKHSLLLPPHGTPLRCSREAKQKYGFPYSECGRAMHEFQESSLVIGKLITKMSLGSLIRGSGFVICAQIRRFFFFSFSRPITSTFIPNTMKHHGSIVVNSECCSCVWSGF